MLKSLKWVLYISLLLLTYVLIFYFLINQKLNVDFSSFYSAAIAFLHHANPYETLQAPFLSNPKELAQNLNPPFFLLLISPLTALNYTYASLFWEVGALISGAVATWICCLLTIPSHQLKKNSIALIIIYFAAYPTLANTSLNQLGGYLFLLIMAGYYFFIHQRDHWAGLCWGLAIAVKLFPGLLLVFILIKRRYTLFFITSLVFIWAWSLPILWSGTSIYHSFYHKLSTLMWYGNSWNASFYGFLFRIFVPIETGAHLTTVKLAYALFFISGLFWYQHTIAKLSQHNEKQHLCFALTLLMMLLLSPFGWIYYCSLLMLPLILVYQAMDITCRLQQALWTLCLILLNTPLANLQTRYTPSLLAKLTLHSFYFYALLSTLVLMLPLVKRVPYHANYDSNESMRSIELVLSCEVLIVLLILLNHLT